MFPVTSRYVLVGDLATRLYMPERMTLDADIFILEVDAFRVHAEFQQSGAQLLGNLSIPGTSWRLTDGTDLDVLESDAPWARDAISRPNCTDTHPVIALQYLILMKLIASRAQDIADVSRMLALASEDDLQATRAIVRRYLPSAAEDLESLLELGRLELS